MADYTQVQATVLTQQALALAASVAGTPVNVAGYLAGIVYIYKGKTATTADLTAGLDYIALQVSPDASGNNWYDYTKFIPSGTAALTEALTATEPVGETVLATSTTAAFVLGSYVFCTDATDEALNSEWLVPIAVAANVSHTYRDGLLFAKAADDDVYDQAERWAVGIDFAGVQRIRLVAQHLGATGSGWVIKAILEAASAIV